MISLQAMPFLNAAGHSLHYERIEGEAGKPPLVFLHEGLGSIRQWRDFPAKLCAATGCTGFVYDRYGYGQSDVLAEPRRTVRFMHDEALISLPRVVSELGLSKPVLVGHSDGASIALIHAGAGYRTRGVAVMAPHVFIEPVCLSSIEKAKVSFEPTSCMSGRSRSRLSSSWFSGAHGMIPTVCAALRMSGSLRRPMKTWKKRSGKKDFAKICSIASMSFAFTSPPCGNVREE